MNKNNIVYYPFLVNYKSTNIMIDGKLVEINKMGTHASSFAELELHLKDSIAVMELRAGIITEEKYYNYITSYGGTDPTYSDIHGEFTSVKLLDNNAGEYIDVTTQANAKDEKFLDTFAQKVLKPIHAGKLDGIDFPKKVTFNAREAEILQGFIHEMAVSFGNKNGVITINDEVYEFGKDPTYGNGNEYNDYLAEFGQPSPKWIAREYVEFACDGCGEKALNSAFTKLQKAGLLNYDTTKHKMTIQCTVTEDY